MVQPRVTLPCADRQVVVLGRSSAGSTSGSAQAPGPTSRNPRVPPRRNAIRPGTSGELITTWLIFPWARTRGSAVPRYGLGPDVRPDTSITRPLGGRRKRSPVPAARGWRACRAPRTSPHAARAQPRGPVRPLRPASREQPNAIMSVLESSRSPDPPKMNGLLRIPTAPRGTPRLPSSAIRVQPPRTRS